MPDRLYERHQDNVIDVGAIVGTLAAGKQYTGIQVQVDADAPFSMRSLAARMTWDLAVGQANLQYLFVRWKRANGDYVVSQSQWMPLLEWTGNYGLGGNPYPWWPEEKYPANSVIEVDVWNNNSAAVTLAGVQLVARGVKLFGPRDSAYPARFRPLNFTRSVKVSNVGTGPFLLSSFVVNPVTDADFVFRKFQAGCVYNGNAPSAFFQARNVWVTLRDQDGQPYSNAPVDINILGGCSFAGYPTGTFPGKEQTGPFHPGLLYSEIYIPRLAPFLMDIKRDDSSYGAQAGIGNVRMDFALGGAKVFAR